MNGLLHKALAILQAIPDVKFLVVMPDGKEYAKGNLQSMKGKRGPPKHPFGSARFHYKPYLADLQIGNLIEIPYEKFDVQSLRSGISAHCCTIWGKGSAITAVNRSKKCIEVLRMK